MRCHRLKLLALRTRRWFGGMKPRAAAWGLALACLAVLLLSAAVHAYSDKAILYETFDEGWSSRWTHSKQDKYDGTFDVVPDKDTKDLGLQVSNCVFNAPVQTFSALTSVA